MAERFADPAVPQRIAVDLALLGHDDEWLRDIALSVRKAAKQPDANARYLRRPVPGIGAILSLVLLSEMHAIQRFPRGQDFVSSCRRVTCAKESAGKRSGTSGTKIGNASLQWAFSEAAVWFLRANPAGQKYLSRLEQKHGKGKALTVLAHQLARAVYDMLKRHTACDRHTFLHGSRSGVGEPGASLDTNGISLQTMLWHHVAPASLHAYEHGGAFSRSPGRGLDTHSDSSMTAMGMSACRVLPLTRTCPSLAHHSCAACALTRTVGGHRYVSRP